MNTSLGYSKRTLTNTDVLLSGGGNKPLSEFIGSISWDATNRKIKYTPVGGSVTDLVTLSSQAITNYLLPAAKTNALGGIIVSNALTTAVTLTSGNGTTANRYYGIQIDKDGKAFVNIPWTNTWNQNTATQAGYVTAPGENQNGKVWMTGSDGTPSWQNANNHTHNYITSLGNKNASDLSTTYSNGLSVAGIYNNGYPFAYGSTITAKGNGGYFQIAGQWNNAVSSLTDYDYPTEMYIRGRRDSYDVWTTWTRVLTNRNWSSVITLPTKDSWNYDDKYVTALDTSGNYLTWTKNGTTNNITVPYASNADKVDGYHADKFFKLYTRAEIGTSPNFNNPKIGNAPVNGYFEIRTSNETTGESGSKPFNIFGSFINITYSNTIFQLAGNTSSGWKIRGRQKANVESLGTGDDLPWQTILTDANSSVSGGNTITNNVETPEPGDTLTVKINNTSQSITNTWRGIQDNLTSSTNTTESLSAKQGYLLANGSARDNTKLPLDGGTMTGTLTVPKIRINGKHSSSNTSKGIYYYNGTTDYLLIGYGSSNLWIGANETAGTHHTGSTYISAGSGNVYISKLVNETRSNYIVYHAGNIPSNSSSEKGVVPAGVASSVYMTDANKNPSWTSIDSAVTSGSSNLVTSGAVFTAIANKVAGAVQYLGTISSEAEMKALSTAGYGDFARIATSFSFTDASGESVTAHVGDVVYLISNEANAYATSSNWVVAHTEIDTDTWTAASTSASGYIPKLVTGGTNLETPSTDYVLAYVNGNATPVWRKLPGNAYANTQYYLTLNDTVNGTSGKTNLGTIYAPTTSGTGFLKSSVSNNTVTWSYDNTSYLPLIGGTMTGGITMAVGSSAFNDKGILFGTGDTTCRVSSSNNGSIGVYTAGSIYLRPGSATSASSYGVVIGSNSITYNDNKIWHAGNDGPTSGLNADLLDGLHASDFPILSKDGTAFVSGGTCDVTEYGTYYADGKTIAASLTNTPHTTSNFKLWHIATGHNNYPIQIAIAYKEDVYIRGNTAGTWRNWKKFALTDSDITGTAANVTGVVEITHGGTGATTRLDALKALTNENVGTNAQYFLTVTNQWAKGGYTSVADAKTVLAMTGATSSAAGGAGIVPAPPSDGYDTKFLGADGTWKVPDYPTNADTVDGYHASSLVKYIDGKFTQHQSGVWTNILRFTTASGSLRPSITFNWLPTECSRDAWGEFNINIRNNNIIFNALWKGTTIRILKLVGDGTTWNLWVSGNKDAYDPYGFIQITSQYSITSYSAGTLAYSDSEPTDTYSATPVIAGTVSYATSAGSVAWENVTSKSETATRWPSWSEVTDKPSTFTPSNHTHDYLPLSGGTMTGDIIMGTSHYIYGVNETSGSMLHFDGNRTVVGSTGATSTLATHLRSKTGHLTCGTSNEASYTIWDSGNDGSGSGLDADLLDGYQAKQLPLITRVSGTQIASNTDLNDILEAGTYYCSSSSSAQTLSNTPYIGGNFRLWHIQNTGTAGANEQWGAQLLIAGSTSGRVFLRGHSNTTFGDWKEFAYLTSNVASATQLQTARTLWGQSFDGSSNVSGFMNSVSGLIYQNNLTEDWTDGNNTHPWYGIDYRHCTDSSEAGKAYTSISSYFGLYFKTGGKSFIFDGGNVGIGTTAPSYKLDVNGTLGVSDNITIYTETTTEADKYSGLTMSVKDTTTGLTYSRAVIRGYQDHGESVTNGLSLVINGGGNTFISSGESAANHYALYRGSSAERLYLTADTTVYIQGNANTIGNRKGIAIAISGNVIPIVADEQSNKTSSLGTADYRFNNLYVGGINADADIYLSTNNKKIYAVDKDETNREILRLTNNNTLALGYGVRSIVSGTGIYAGTKGFYVCTNGDTKRMFIDSSGNVGIGTVEPSEKLEVNGNIKAANLQITSINGVTVGDSPQFTDTTYSAGTLALYNTGTDTENRVWSASVLKSIGDLYLPLAGGTMTGNITGVGTISASGNITITKSSTNETKFAATNNNGTIELLTSSNRGVYNRTNAKWLIATNGTNSWLDCGNVAIASSANTTYKLYVDGTVGITGATTLSSTLSVSNLLTASGGVTIPSGKNLKIGDAQFYWDSTSQGIKITKPLSDYNPTSNFKTINGNSIIGTGNITIEGGGATKLYTSHQLTRRDQWFRFANLVRYGASYLVSIRDNYYNNSPTPVTWIINVGYESATITQIGKVVRTPTSLTKLRIVRYDNYGDFGFHLEVYTPYQTYVSQNTPEINIMNLGRNDMTDGIELVHDPNYNTKWLEVNSNIQSGETLIEETDIPKTATLWGQSFDGVSAVSGSLTGVVSIEMNNSALSGFGGFIDFHYNASSADYTSRIIEDANGRIAINSVLYAQYGGNVGIGTTPSSSYKLYVNGNTTATNFYTTSDRNKKKNISEFSEHIRKFQLKDTEKWNYGVIAQEVEEMFREGEDGNMTVNYDSILSYYIGQLENKVKVLEEKIRILETRQNKDV